MSDFNTSVRSYLYTENGSTTALTNSYQEFTFIDVESAVNFTAHGLIISNDDSTSIYLSKDGTTDHIEIKASETLTFERIYIKSIYIKGASGGEDYRLYIW